VAVGTRVWSVMQSDYWQWSFEEMQLFLI